MEKKRLLYVLFVLIAGFGFTACGSDDNEDVTTKVNNTTGGQETPTKQDEPAAVSIIGTWKNTWNSGPRGYTAYTFLDDGTGFDIDKGIRSRFNYTYNAQTKVLNIVYSEYNKENYSVDRLTASELVFDGDTYVKSDLTLNMLILGEWFFDIDVSNTFDKKTRVRFDADWDVEGTGTYTAKDYNDNSYMDESGYSFSGLSGLVSGTWSIIGNKIKLSDPSQIEGEYIIDGLVPNGCRLIRASNPQEHPYILGGWKD